MITSKKIDRIIIGVVIVVLFFTGILMYLPEIGSDTTELYETSLFTKTEVMSVNIEMDEAEWAQLLENAASEEYSACDITINGTIYRNVGIRAKGNTSLSQIVNDDTTDRYSFKIKFDEYVEGQNCDGLNKLVLNNIFQDNTYMKEYMSYDLMASLGIATPLYAFSNISLNGETWGTYLALESLEEDFAYRNFGSDYGALYKVEGSQFGGGGIRKVIKQDGEAAANDGAAANDRTMANDRTQVDQTSTSDGTDLVYTDDDFDSYSGILENASYDVTDSQKEALIEAIKNLNEGTDLEKYVDVDQTLKYFAANVFLVNLDSYLSNMTHNYYIYEEDGQITPIPWDYNLSFAGFQSGTSGGAINYPIDTVLSGVELSERPLIGVLLENEEYKEKYHQYLNEIVTNYIMNGTYENTIDYMTTILDDSIKNDPTSFTTYDEYKEAVSQLKRFGTLRAFSVQGQLSGTIPSTSEGQSTDASNLIDASDIDLSVLGTQGGGMVRIDKRTQTTTESETGEANQQNPQQDAEENGQANMGAAPDMDNSDTNGQENETNRGNRGNPPNMDDLPSDFDEAAMKEMMGKGGGPGGEMGMQQSGISTDYLILCGASIGILFLIMIIVKKYKRG